MVSWRKGLFDIRSEPLPRHFIRILPADGILTGWNEDDGTFFEPAKINSNADVLTALRSETFLDNEMRDESFAEMLALYPVSECSNYPAERFPGQFFRTARISRDIQFTCPSIFMVDAMANYSEPDVRNYLYDLNAFINTADEADADELYLGVYTAATCLLSSTKPSL